MAKTRKAAIYCRMSSTEQEDSIEQQLREIQKLVDEHGYEVVAKYLDEGWSGDDEHRPEFTEMLQVAKGYDCPWKTLLVWDLDRFSRSHSRRVIGDLNTLADAGVLVHSVQQGLKDLRKADIAEMVLLIVQADQNHQFLKKMAPTVVRGMLSAFKAETWIGPVCYGYRQLPREKGQHVKWEQIPEQAEVVRWIFSAFVEKDLGYCQIAKLLNQRSIPSPKGKKWGLRTVRWILLNEKYAGHVVFGKRHFGKHVVLTAKGARELTDEEMDRLTTAQKRVIDRRHQESKRGVKRKRKVQICNHAQGETIEIRDAIDCPIISEATWLAAQKKVRDIHAGTRRKQRRTLQLSGIAVCGLCGSPISGFASGRRVGYRCSAASRSHAAGGAEHRNYSVRLDILHAVVLDQILSQWLSEEAICAVVKKAVTASEKSSKHKQRRERQIQTELSKITAEIKEQEQRALVADTRLFPVISAKLSELDAKAVAMRAELGSLNELDDLLHLSSMELAKKIEGNLLKIKEELVSAAETDDLDALRLAFSRIVSEVKVFPGPRELSEKMQKKTGKTHSDHYWELERSEITIGISVSPEEHSRVYFTLHTVVLQVTHVAIHSIVRRLREKHVREQV